MTFRINRTLTLACLFCTGILLSSCKDADDSSGQAVAAPLAVEQLEVHKSPTCGCCADWIEHMEANGFSAQVSHTEDMNALKAGLQIGSRYQSCHTAVSEQGYVFEGHVPAKLVRRFLDEKPEHAIGLAVPGMPLGSPGMEMDDRFNPYSVLLLMEDGSSQVYARIDSPEQQY